MAKELIRRTTIKADIEAEVERLFEKFNEDFRKQDCPLETAEHIEFRSAFVKYEVYLIDENTVENEETVKRIAMYIVKDFIRIYDSMLTEGE